MATVSEILSDFVANADYKSIPKHIVSFAKLCIIDLIGVTLAGASYPISKILKAYVEEKGGFPHATAIGLWMKSSSENAALVNGTFAHYLDYDDVVVPMKGAGGAHVSAAVLPAALAIGEQNGLSGRDLIAAYAVGCEVTYGVGRGVDPSHFTKGWHTTCTEGVFGATAAAGKLLQLNREELTYSFGLSGSQSAGLRENFGTMTKPLHAGLAAENGVKSAMLAKLGFTSSKTIFEGQFGFCNVASEKANPTEITSKLGKWESVSNIRLKLYPCCALTYTAIDAARSIIRDHGLKPHDLEAITVTANPMVRGIVPFDNPITPLEAKFSMPFCVAVALTDGAVTLQHFTQEKLEFKELAELVKRVKFVFDAKVPDFGAIVEVRSRQGKTHSQALNQPKGTAENPLSENEIIEKFKTCARLVLSKDQVERLLTQLMKLEELDDVGALLSFE